MSFRRILVPVDGSDVGRAAIESAFAVAQAHKAHVLGLHISVELTDMVPMFGEGMTGALAQELLDMSDREAAARTKAAREMFETMRAAHGIPLVGSPESGGPGAAWAEMVGQQEDTLVRYGRLADLIVIGRPGEETTAAGDLTFSTALFETGHPVLVAGRGRVPLGRRIAIAWNGTAQAARAVSASLPFLARAEAVTVVTVATDDDAHSLDGAIEYLAWHGITATPAHVAPRVAPGEALQQATAGCDLVVMGGYSHSRLRELVLGGVTRYMVEKSSVPLLMAH